MKQNPARSRHRLSPAGSRSIFIPKRSITCAAREFGGRFALELERDQDSRDQDVGYDVVENFRDNGFGFGGVERAAREHFVECIAQVDHAPTLARKLRSRVLPPGVPIDSGWNCTPSIG